MDTTIQQDQRPQKHPKGLYLLFVTELWERYSYYGMRAILVLYLTTAFVSGGLGVDKATAVTIYGLYTGFIYFTPIIGGYLTDHFISLRKAITIGGITMAIGDFTIFLTHSQWGLYTGLALLIIGNGFFKPNISTLVGELYPKNDKRKDSAFTIFYMGINIGAFFSPLVAGFLAEDLFLTTLEDGTMHYGFKYAFLASSIGMVIGQLVFTILSKRMLGDVGTKPLREGGDYTNKNHNHPLTKTEKRRTTAILILASFVVFFWAGFEQAGSSFTLYTQNFIDRDFFGYTVPVSWFQSLNPLFIVLLAPIVSLVWKKLASSKRGDLKIPTKMALGMILLGLGFMILVPAVLQTGSDAENIALKANMAFIVLTYFFHSLGELCLSPVGLSMVSQIAPVKIASLLMGVWMGTIGVANLLAGQLASLTQTLGYLEIFAIIGGLAITLGIVLLFVSKPLNKLMYQE